MTLNGDVSGVSIWAKQWFVSLNEGKTESMVCTRSQNYEEQNLFLYIVVNIQTLTDFETVCILAAKLEITKSDFGITENILT